MERLYASGYYRTFLAVVAAGVLLSGATEGIQAIRENTEAIKLDAAAQVYDHLSGQENTQRDYTKDLAEAESLRHAADRHRDLRDSDAGWAAAVGGIGLAAIAIRR